MEGVREKREDGGEGRRSRVRHYHNLFGKFVEIFSTLITLSFALLWISVHLLSSNYTQYPL